MCLTFRSQVTCLRTGISKKIINQGITYVHCSTFQYITGTKHTHIDPSTSVLTMYCLCGYMHWTVCVTFNS